MNNLDGKKILMVISPGQFRDEEYDIPKKDFEKVNAKVITASTTTENVTGKMGMIAKPDILLKDVNSNEYDTIVFVGGPGVQKYWDDKTCHELAKSFYNEKKYVCAICSAPVILAKAGMLKGISATSYSGDQLQMEQLGVKFSKNSVEVADRFITGNGPAAAHAFAQAIIENLINSRK